jgi:tetratricopeptide (TPR) repeat protein
VTGELAAIQEALAARDLDGALARARDWRAREPGNVLALIGLGEALEARREGAAAARAYGSIIDLFPGRADMRRFAGERLARLAAAKPAAGKQAAGEQAAGTLAIRELAIDTFRRAVADRPDHLTGHRLLAYALVRAGRLDEAFAAIIAGLGGTYREGSYAGGRRVLGEDAAMIGAAYAASAPAKRGEIAAALARHKLAPATERSTRFVLYWETDANDVDFHIHDARGGHAFYSRKQLPSGGELYADVTTGYGPECFTIPGTPKAGPYRLSLEYYAQGPMGYGMGLLEIQTFDPRRGFAFEARPFVIMNDRAKVDLGTYAP